MKKLAICIPTYNRKQSVEDILSKINSIFREEELDVYIYDSSEKSVDYSKKEWKINVYYKKLNSSVHSNEKIFIIYRAKEIIEKYEYTWILPDYMFYSDWVIEDIKKSMIEKNDYILINYWDNEKKEEYVCNNNDYIFQKYASLITQYGTIIIRNEIFSKKIDLELIADKYLTNDKMNFSHVGLYFEIMAKLKDLKLKVIGCEKKDYYKSPSKKLYISKENLKQKKNEKNWETAFHVWAVSWPETIKALPKEYSGKWEVIKSEVVRGGFFDERFLMSQRSIGATKLRVVLMNFSKWKYISLAPVLKAIGICLMPKKYAEWCTYNRSIFVKKKVEYNLKQLKKISTKKEIYIYGAGKKADEYIRILEANYIPIKSLVVTDARMFVESAYGYKVIGIEQLKSINSEYVVILALNEENKYAVKRLLNDYNMTGYLYEDKINVW